MRRTWSLVVIALGCAVADARAEPFADDASPMSGPRDAPTLLEDAYEACFGKAQGMACDMLYDGRELRGSCVLALNEELICLPDELSSLR